ncbi:SymE family type I addiction module toxin [Caballeronia pedi]|uniref:SymE family type I addiction module toxin n=1 Tax=Caballeronia pedi TaxID=1777141 RepID=UPI00244A11C1|nr:SymE family type I addiction module toxin [Caballeronia pedi]
MFIQQSHPVQHNWHKPQHLRTEPTLFPWIRLAGRWIEHAGFAPGQRVRVAVEHGKLTITCE